MTTPTQPADLLALVALVEMATPGTWEVRPQVLGYSNIAAVGDPEAMCVDLHGRRNADAVIAAINFIREHGKALVESLAAHRGEVEPVAWQRQVGDQWQDIDQKTYNRESRLDYYRMHHSYRELYSAAPITPDAMHIATVMFDANGEPRPVWHGGHGKPNTSEPLYTHPPQAQAGAGDGVALIAAERRRQIEAEGWTPEHDDAHDCEEMALAAACYAIPFAERLFDYHRGAPVSWPWDAEWWKPGDRIRELVKAGALVAAEIDRLQRVALEARHDPE